MWETKTVTSLRQPVEPLKNNGYKSSTEGTELIRNPAFLGRGCQLYHVAYQGISDCLLDVTRGS